jgi:hypothetical protein
MEHIHTPNDGRGRRKVLLNEREIDGVFYADTKKGIVDRYRTDALGMKILDKHRKRILSRRYHGKVEVISIQRAE